MRQGEALTQLLQVAREFRPRILSRRDEIEISRRMPADLAHDLARAGFFRMHLPNAYGGMDLIPAAVMEVLEELARADGSVAWCVWNGNAHCITVQLSEEVAKAVYADPDVIIANSTRPSGQAQVEEHGFRVNGRWSLVSGCELSDWMMLLCSVYENGSPRVTASGAAESRYILCRSAACEIIDTWSAGGLRGTGSHDVVVKNLFVPAKYAASFADPVAMSDLRYRLPPLSRVLPGLGAMALGVARTAIEALTEMAIAKQPDRSNKPLREFHGAQIAVSQAEALVRSARLFLFEAVNQVWDAVMAGTVVTVEARAGVRLATSHAVSNAAQAVDLMFAAAGASSLYTSSPLERSFRDIHAMTQHITVHPRVMESAGRVLLGLQPEIPL